MNKFTKRMALLSPVVASLGSTTAYFGLSVAEPSPASTDDYVEHATYEPDSANDVLRIFPKLHQQDFYKYIRIKGGDPYIDDDMTARIIHKVLAEMQFSDGKVLWGYHFVDGAKRQQLELVFKWIPGASGTYEPFVHKYTFSLKSDF